MSDVERLDRALGRFPHYPPGATPHAAGDDPPAESPPQSRPAADPPTDGRTTPTTDVLET